MNNSISWFEDYIIRVLKEAEYNIVAHDKKLASGLGDIDIIAEKNENKYCVEVKFSRVTEKVVERINYISSMYKMIPLLITATELKEKRNYYHEKYSDVILIDITNLLYALKDNIQKGCGEFHERIFRYRWLHGAGRWCVQIICR